jgi:hypothetical protein
MGLTNHDDMQLNKDEMVECSDLSLTALLILSFPVKLTKHTENGRVCFYFQQSQELQKTINDFWNGTALVEPKAYFNSIKIAKSRIFSSGGTVKWK